MKTFKIESMLGGWFLGDFDPSIYKTKEIEIGMKKIPKGEVADNHYHKKAHELTFLISGSIEYNGKIFLDGEMILIEPYEKNNMHFLKDSTIIIAKWPSVIGDKHY